MKKRFLFTLASLCLMLCVPLTSCETNEVNDTTETTTIENQVKIKGAKTLDVGETVSLSLLFSQKTVPVIWQSLTPSIVTVSQDGVVTALNSGEGKVAVQVSDDPTIQDVVTIVVNEVIKENVQYVKATFTNYDGTILEEDVVEVGDVPQYTKGNPERLSDGNNSYIFIGWDKEIVGINEDTTYVAQYEAAPLSDFLFSVDVENGGYCIDGYTGSNLDIVIPSTYNYRKVVSIGEDAFLNAAITSVTLPETIVAIKDQAFSNCQNLVSMNFPQSIRTLGTQAFYNCVNLRAFIQFGEGITEIPEQAFANCNNLIYVYGPNIKTIGPSAFSNCYMLNFVFNEGLERIEAFAFQWNRVIRDLVLPSTVTFLGQSVFCHAQGLHSIYIPASLETIDYKYSNGEEGYQTMFLDCINLAEIVVDENNPYFMSVNNEGLYSKDRTILYAWTLNRAGAIEISDGCTTIMPSTFYGVTGSNLVIPNTVKTVGEYAFWTANIETVTFEEIEEADTVELQFGTDIFRDSTVEEIVLSSAVRSIPRNFAPECRYLRRVELQDGITTIGDYAFQHDFYLEECDLPSTVTSVGTSAFYQTAIGTVTIPNTLTRIGTSTFSGISTLNEVIFEENSTLSTIGSMAFYETNISSFDMPDSVRTLSGTSQFRYCSNLEEIKLSNNLRTVPGYFIADCPSLKTITFGPGEENTSATWTMSWTSTSLNGTSNIQTINFRGTEEQLANMLSRNSWLNNLLGPLVESGAITINYRYGFTETVTPTPETNI